MNALDVILISIIFISGLSGKYNGLYLQLNRLLSLVFSILITKIFLYKLIGILYPFIGLSNYTKPIIYYLSISVFYVVIRFTLNILLYRYESSKKNKLTDSIGGIIFSIFNSILILSFFLSILFTSIHITSTTIEKLNKSMFFNHIYIIKTIFIDYEK